MKRYAHRIVVVACLALAASTTALAQSPGALVVTGKDWMSASSRERQVFLAGVANMIMAETASARQGNRATPPVTAGITRGVADLSLPQIELRITQWYQANPARISTPVMSVLWQDFVKR